MMDYPGWNYTFQYVPPTFMAQMRLVGTYRGRSAPRFVLEDTATGITYPTFLHDMEFIMKNHVIDHGMLAMREWRFCKRGQNYGITITEDEK
jgi:hypothetical protein